MAGDTLRRDKKLSLISVGKHPAGLGYKVTAPCVFGGICVELNFESSDLQMDPRREKSDG